MKRKFAYLAVFAALAALALPASSMATMSPASSKFEFTGLGTIGTSLGSCTLGKVTGETTSFALGPNTVGIPPVSACTTGTSLTLNNDGSGWGFRESAPIVTFQQLAAEATVLRFSSLPGCKLVGILELRGVFSNSVLSSGRISTYHADSAGPLTWANDGASCALAGKKEVVTYSDLVVNASAETKTPTVHQVKNLSSPSYAITITG